MSDYEDLIVRAMATLAIAQTALLEASSTAPSERQRALLDRFAGQVEGMGYALSGIYEEA